jgi:hypothetical protein
MRRRIALILILLLCACTNPTQEQNAPEAAAQSERPLSYFAVNEVTDTFAWIGKTAKELDVDGTYFDHSGNIAFSGDLFGHTVTGTAYLLTDYEDPDRAQRVSEIWLTDGIENMQVTESALEVRYGEPYAEGEEPYVESNGGTTFWQNYWTGEGVVSLSNGAKNDYYVFSYAVPKEVPEEIANRAAGLSVESLGHRTGVYFHFAEGEAEDLHIEETQYEDFPAYLLTFVQDKVSYRVTIVKGGEALFDTLTASGTWTQLDQELQTCRYRAPESSPGVLYEKNLFGDLWIIEPGEPMKPEEMEAFADFLLHRWLY